MNLTKKFLKISSIGLIGTSLAACGTVSASGNSLSTSDKAMLSRLIQDPFSRVTLPQNIPSKKNTVGFPSSWSHAYANSAHNSAFSVPANSASWLEKGVSWNFAEARAWPLSNNNAYGNKTYGPRSALPTMTQFYGNSTGVSAVGGVIYGESDDQFAYAVNAQTGKLIWRSSPVGNHLMGDPVVSNGIVYVSSGSVGFNFSAVQKFAAHKPAIRGQHVSFNGVYALNAKTGKLIWHFGTMGEAMATPVVKHGVIYFATGSGHIHALNAKTGKSIWNTFVGGIDNMSSPSVLHGKVYVALSVPGWLYALNSSNGKVLWKATEPGVVNTGMGDVSPAVYNNVVVMDAVADPKTIGGKKTLNTALGAVNATTGKILWTTKMGRGPLPPAFKGGVPTIHGNTVYVGSPVTSVYQSYNLQTGKLLWTWHVPNAGPAGAGRGAPTYYKGVLYVSTGPNVYSLNPTTGTVIGQENLGGRFGIVNPVIIGGTIYLANSWDWLMATPVSKVNPNYKA